jgi:hypothetical protein
MYIYKSCGICNKSCAAEDFLKAANGEPLYWFPLPEPTGPMNETVVFCSPQHSLEWHQRNLDSKKENT